MQFNVARMPIRITPCPVYECVAEIRFEPTVAEEMVIAKFFTTFIEQFPEIIRLPILEMPQFIRENDLNLKFSPLNALAREEDKVRLLVGPRSVSVVCGDPYLGWSDFFAVLKNVFDGVEKIKIIKKPTRMGLRFVSFFEKTNVFPHIKAELKLAENSLIDNSENIVRSVFTFGKFKCISQIGNAAVLEDGREGSLIDLDILFEDTSGHFVAEEYGALIDEAHIAEKQIFFSLLKDDFLQKFKPEFAE